MRGGAWRNLRTVVPLGTHTTVQEVEPLPNSREGHTAVQVPGEEVPHWRDRSLSSRVATCTTSGSPSSNSTNRKTPPYDPDTDPCRLHFKGVNIEGRIYQPRRSYPRARQIENREHKYLEVLEVKTWPIEPLWYTEGKVRFGTSTSTENSNVELYNLTEVV